MPDREKVINTLESILNADIYDNWLSVEEHQNVCDAIAMLKEQDALCFALEQAHNTNKYLNDVLAKKGVEPRKIVGLIDCSSPWLQYSCGSCKEPLLIRYKFCPNCGKPIKWKRFI